ncbi:cytochrome c [Verticiella sediminum]|uniref:Cytochrome c n=1 Tax=Verticiella sediminum TaxID=1247510 RepID=A0A556A6I3_9BURK|nr:cytochrome c [Verticiella sediminum]TSH88474.1 cytochrome c [Verticiella sediminum]
MRQRRQGILRTVAPVLAVLACTVSGPTLAADAPQGSIEDGKNKISMCIGCHGIPGYRASFPEVYTVPKIAGQNAAYVAAALNEYKSGARSHPTMDGIAKSLSDQDIADLAAYYASRK